MHTTTHFGAPSYTVRSDKVQAYISVLCGHLTGTFTHGKREFFPYFVSPWWNEALPDDMPPTMRLLRGDYFCFPFGINAEAYKGVQHPLHGKTANNCWDFVEVNRSESRTVIRLATDLSPAEGRVEKIVTLRDGQPIIYCNHKVIGFSGRSSFGNHPNIQCPEEPGSAFIDMSEPLTGFTAPVPLGAPAERGYFLLRPGVEISDRTKVPTVYGDTVDLTRYPTPKGYEDGVLFVSDPSKDMAFTSVSIPARGYLYFQLKDPRVAAATLLWMPNGGNYNPPFSGRVAAAIGVEEITGNFFYGIIPSIEKNPILDRGYKTYGEFDAQRPTSVKLISGVVAVDKGFRGVKDIVRKSASEITILGKGGEKLDVPCHADFLVDGMD